MWAKGRYPACLRSEVLRRTGRFCAQLTRTRDETPPELAGGTPAPHSLCVFEYSPSCRFSFPVRKTSDSSIKTDSLCVLGRPFPRFLSYTQRIGNGDGNRTSNAEPVSAQKLRPGKLPTSNERGGAGEVRPTRLRASYLGCRKPALIPAFSPEEKENCRPRA